MPEPTLDIELIRQKVLPLLGELSPLEQHIFHLRYYEYMTQQRIADELGIPQRTISDKIRSCHKKIRKHLTRQRITFVDFL